jgi:hypothetical protein
MTKQRAGWNSNFRIGFAGAPPLQPLPGFPNWNFSSQKFSLASRVKEFSCYDCGLSF